MFVRIARHYDLMNRLMTFGRDQAWRRYTTSQVGLGSRSLGSQGRKPERVLDVATGTGDLALEVLRQYPDAQVLALDFVAEMLALAQRKAAAEQEDPVQQPDPSSPTPNRRSPSLLAGDALRIPFGDGAFDAIVTGFALRNVTDIPAAFAEMARVTRPGGRLACLEIAKPSAPLVRHLFAFYFYRIVPLVGGWITGERAAYTYLPHSLTLFLTPKKIAEVMRQTGWQEVRYKRLMLGTVAVHVGVRKLEQA